MQDQDHLADGGTTAVCGGEGRTALHTPLPWKAVTPCPGECCWHLVPADFDETDLKRDNWHEFINLPEMSEVDAKFIVLRVNTYGELLAALKSLHDDIAEYARINNIGEFDNHSMRRARAAIAAAPPTA